MNHVFLCVCVCRFLHARASLAWHKMWKCAEIAVTQTTPLTDRRKRGRQRQHMFNLVANSEISVALETRRFSRRFYSLDARALPRACNGVVIYTAHRIPLWLRLAFNIMAIMCGNIVCTWSKECSTRTPIAEQLLELILHRGVSTMLKKIFMIMTMPQVWDAYQWTQAAAIIDSCLSRTRRFLFK